MGHQKKRQERWEVGERPTLPLPLALKMEEGGHEPRHVALEVGNSTWLTARNPKELKSASKLDKPGDRVSLALPKRDADLQTS